MDSGARSVDITCENLVMPFWEVGFSGRSQESVRESHFETRSRFNIVH